MISEVEEDPGCGIADVVRRPEFRRGCGGLDPGSRVRA
jgi:hypothetical protein